MIYTTSTTNDISYDITTGTDVFYNNTGSVITWDAAFNENIECLSIRTQKDIDDEKLIKLFKEPL